MKNQLKFSLCFLTVLLVPGIASFAQVVTQIRDLGSEFLSSVPPQQTISYFIYNTGSTNTNGCKVDWSEFKNSAIYADGVVLSSGPLITISWQNVNGNAKVKAKYKDCVETSLNGKEMTYDVPIRYIGSPGPILINGVSANLLDCSIAPITLSINPVTNATNYNWSLPSGWSQSSNGNSITVTPNLSGEGTVSVSATRNDVGYVPTNSQLVVTRPLPTTPTISGNSPAVLCTGQTINFTAAASNADQYFWETVSGSITLNNNPGNPVAVSAA